MMVSNTLLIGFYRVHTRKPSSSGPSVMFPYPIRDDSSALRMMVVSQLKLWRPRASNLEKMTYEEKEEDEAVDEAKQITWRLSYYRCSLELAYSCSVRASQSCRERFISLLILILRIPYTKCIPSSTHAPSMEKVKKFFSKERIPLTISVAMTVAIRKGLGKSGRS